MKQQNKIREQNPLCCSYKLIAFRNTVYHLKSMNWFH